MTAPASPASQGVTVRLAGGLGNQLFQYAAAREVAARLDCPMLVDTSGLARVGPGDTPREFALGWLVDAAHVLDGGSAHAPGRLRAALERRVPALARGQVFQQQGFGYDARIADVQRGVVLAGYFQSARYFAQVEHELRADILARIPRSAWRTEAEAQLQGLGSWIAVHVRRGDYLLARNTAYHGLLGRPYYARALAALAERGVTGTVALFSDDPAAAREMLGDLAAGAIVLEPASSANAAESIALMAGAPAVVTANSSFSWWAGWLGDPASTVVACPTPWLHEARLDERDLRPPAWIVVDAGFDEA
ncbi:MAG: alpha-1,2-fucosyltransferase [Candidatus Nanopelagicales bacterium]|nr:alpha-1,2-fucosyltransferase [Candidatus Nanopelagicales bacterium]